MANEIKLKRGSGSDPSASDLVVGELAIRTDNGKLFTKKDNGSVAEISGGGGGIDDGDKGDITVSNGGETFTIDDGAITTAKIADQAVDLTKLPHGTVLNNGKFLRANNGADPTFETITQYQASAVIALFDQSATPVQRLLANTEGVTVQGTSGAVSKLMFRDRTTANFLKFKPVDTFAATVEFTLPSADGSANTVLKTDGNGVMSFGSIVNASVASDAAIDVSKLNGVMPLAGGTFVNDVVFAGTNYNATWDKSASIFRFNDDAKIAVGTGTGNDMEIFHESTSNTNEIIAADGDIHIQADNFMLISDDTAGRAIYLDNSSGHLELGFDGNHCVHINGSQTEFIKDVKFDGATAGRDIVFDRSANALEFADNAKAVFGNAADLEIYHDGSNSYLQNSTGVLYIRGGGDWLALQAENGENSIICKPNGTVELYHNNSKKFETISSGVSTDGLMNFNGTGDKILLGDNGKISLGGSLDLQIYHGTNSYIDNATGGLYIRNTASASTSEHIYIQPNNTEHGIIVKKDDAVELYHNGTKKFDTVSGGTRIFGYLSMQGSGGHIYLPDSAELKVGSGEDLKIYHDGSNSYIKDSGTGNLIVHSSQFEALNAGGSQFMLRCIGGASVELYEAGDKKLETTSSGVSVTGTCTATTFSGSGASLTSLNASNISSGTISDARLPATITSNITGSSASCTGNAATASNAATLDGIDSSQFVRSDANDTLNGQYTISTSTNEKLILAGSADPYIRWQEGTTNKAYIVWNSAGNFELANQETGECLRIASGSNGLEFKHGGTYRTVWHSGNDGSGTGLHADLLDGVHGSSYLRSDANDTATGTLTVRDILISSNYHLQRSNHHSGHLEGSYDNVGANSTKSNPIYTIGSSYNPSDAALSNMYGIGFTHGNNASFTPSGAGWGLYVAADGDSRVFLDGSLGRVYIGTNNRFLSDITGQYGSVQVNASGVNGWEGYSIDGRAVFMHNGGTETGLYNDVNNHWLVYCIHGGSVNLYHNGTSKISTASNGINVSGGVNINDSNTRVHEGDANSVRLQTNSGYVDIGPMNTTYTHVQTDRANFYFNRRLYIDGNVEPYFGGSYDLGASNNRWQNLYVNDLQLSNESSGGNSVDGTWGDWTLQEGEDTIFMLNNRNGKKYKMNLTEVS